jgi:hypothetical protein
MVRSSRSRTEILGDKQLDFSDCELTTAKKQPMLEQCPAEMEAVVISQPLLDLIELQVEQSTQVQSIQSPGHRGERGRQQPGDMVHSR